MYKNIKLGKVKITIGENNVRGAKLTPDRPAGTDYEIVPVKNSRLLIVPASSMHRWKFYNIVRGRQQPVKFLRSGSKCVARVSRTVEVWKKPRVHEFHYEYMRNESRALAGWGSVGHDQLVENLLEFVERI